MPHRTLARLVIPAIVAATLIAYLAGGANGVGVAERDRVFSPADSSDVQLAMPARDVPVAGAPTISTLSGKLALEVARGRRSALRDLAAVAGALTTAAFAAWLAALGLPLLIVALSSISLAASPLFWGRGIAWTFDALTPGLTLLALWSASRWWTTRRGRFAAMAIAFTTAALLDRFVAVVDRQDAGGALAIVRELTPVGTLVAGAGIVSSLLTPARRYICLAWLAAAVAAAPAPAAAFDAVGLTVAIGAWTAFAHGLTWIAGALPQRMGAALVTAIAVMAIADPSLTRQRLWQLGQDVASELRTQAASDVRIGELPADAVFVAEAHRGDAMLRLSAALNGRTLPLIAQTSEVVGQALDDGDTVFAFANAEAHLERRGFLFERVFLGNVPVAAAAGRVPCVPLTAGDWHDVSLLVANGSFVVHATGGAGARVVVRAAASAPPTIIATDPQRVMADIGDAVEVDAGMQALRTAGTGPTAGSRDPGLRPHDIRIGVSEAAPPAVVTLASPPAYAVASVEGSATASICPGPQRSGVILGSSPGIVAAVPMNDNAPFMSGWHPVEADPDLFRWTGAPDASLRVSITKPGDVRVTITATPASRPQQKPTIGLTVNGCTLETHSMQAGQGDYEWVVGAGCWVPGANQVWVHTSPLISPATLFSTHDTRLLGARIGAIRLARQ